MAIQFQVLGQAGQDNALLVRVDSGQAISRLLFDCGENCLNTVPLSEIQQIDHLFFSHLHMDHAAGFDSFFRCNFNRETPPVHVWGPPQTTRILHHRFRGFWWNLHVGLTGLWKVYECLPDEVRVTAFHAGDAFESACPELPQADHGEALLQEADYTVRTIRLEHHGPCLAYLVRENPRQNIDARRLQAAGLRPGPWIQLLKDGSAETVEIQGRVYECSQLRADLLIESEGDSIAYLTDFLLDEPTQERLVPFLQDCQTMVCEAQYQDAELELATRHHHLTLSQVAQLAGAANVGRLILFHLSARYDKAQWNEMLADCRAQFPRASFADHWDLD